MCVNRRTLSSDDFGRRKLDQWALSRDILVHQEVLLRLARVSVTVVLQIWADWDWVVLGQQGADRSKGRIALGVTAE